MSDFGCLELFTTGITAIDAISRVGPGLIIGARDTYKSTVAIDAMINQDAWYCIYVRVGQETLSMAQVSGADESAALEFNSATVGLALDLETFYLGVVLSWSVINTNLNWPIPVGSGYAGPVINAVSAPVVGIGQVEMSDFRCLESFADITAIDTSSIGGRISDKSTVRLIVLLIKTLVIILRPRAESLLWQCSLLALPNTRANR